jgi:hypothetical protein
MPATPACILIAEQEVGPYYIDGEVLSQNITEGRPGLPLTLRVALVDAKRCSPLSHAAQGIWHCDALGVNCGFTANSPDGAWWAPDLAGCGRRMLGSKGSAPACPLRSALAQAEQTGRPGRDGSLLAPRRYLPIWLDIALEEAGVSRPTGIICGLATNRQRGVVNSASTRSYLRLLVQKGIPDG